ncbi:hypothetical protein Emin_0736 [Elusimicrobium minutum Pei191]|uniref:Uncharacterized protein n=1 Tax=Elusimicrobium minutum (strain Pei191) TaxID=445932 RepID=B2KCP5_ELUMP|nr:hypothetical protein [Elusimicrobium minutum]ACC98291.1 hypothetical protein Emin_0736 [Elusimicrobium minutum Pei191]
MKKIFIILNLILVFSINAFCKASYDDFAANVTKDNLKYFAKDIGGLIGSSTFTTGRVLGWGGFQVGPRASMWFEPHKNNTALGGPKNVGSMVMPWIQADIGMPFRIDGFIRAGSYNGLTAAGGGLRWGILRPVQNEWSFQTMIVLAANAGVADSFSVAHYQGALVLSMTMKHFTPYISAGVDSTKVTIQHEGNALNGTHETVFTPRYTAGLNFKLPLYLDLSLAGNWANYGPGAEASFSLRF